MHMGEVYRVVGLAELASSIASVGMVSFLLQMRLINYPLVCCQYFHLGITYCNIFSKQSNDSRCN